MSGFCSYKTEDIEKAKTYYDAFYALFMGHFKANPPASNDRAMYIGAIKNYCKFLIDEEDADVVDERYGELFDWCIAATLIVIAIGMILYKTETMDKIANMKVLDND